MKKLLIAEYSEEMAQALLEILEDSFHIETCVDGDTALELLHTFQPDIVLMNMMLPGKDAITVLQKSVHKPPFIFVHSHFANPYIERKLSELGISMLLLSPTPSTLSVRLLELAKDDQNILQPVEEQLTALLYALRFPTYREGYRQLIQAIIKYREDPHQHMTKELYPHVAQVCGCKSAEAVEHSIRSVIQQAWDHRDPAVWQQYLPNCHKRPSNKEFISQMAYLLGDF